MSGYQQSSTQNPQPSPQLPPGWTVKREDSETSREITKWFADRGLEVNISIAEGPPNGRSLTDEEYRAIEVAADKINSFDDAPNKPIVGVPVTGQAVLGQQAGVLSGMGRKKQLAEEDWRKRRPQVMDALDEVFAEVKRSLDKHGGFRSGHEGYGILLEEVDELWDEIKADNSGGVEAHQEAIQVAAMAVKYAVYIAGNSR